MRRSIVPILTLLILICIPKAWATDPVNYQLKGILPDSAVNSEIEAYSGIMFPLPQPVLEVTFAVVPVSFTPQSYPEMDVPLDPKSVHLKYRGKELSIRLATVTFFDKYPGSHISAAGITVNKANSVTASGGLFDIILKTDLGTITIVANGENAATSGVPLLGKIHVENIVVYWVYPVPEHREDVLSTGPFELSDAELKASSARAK